MLRNYLRVAYRRLLKNRSYVIINTFGLGIALACCITAYILVAFNIEFDNFHRSDKIQNIYRVHSHVLLNGSDRRIAISAPLLIGPMATQDFAGIRRYVRYAGSAVYQESVSYIDETKGINKTFSEGVVFADSALFKMFDFPLIAGSHAAFEDIQSVFLEEEVARKYFGDEDPIGKVLSIGFPRDVRKNFVVGGVIKKIPVNSSIRLPILIRFEHFEEMRAMDMKPWEDWNLPAIFYELEDTRQAVSISNLFDKFIPLRNEAYKEQVVEKYSLEPFKSKVDNQQLTWTYLSQPINLDALLIFVVLALMILLIACFNLTNTSIALTSSRLKEIGIRRAAGAGRRQIIIQFLVETMMVILLSLAVGYLISRLIIPEFTAMWGLPYGMKDLGGVNLVLSLLIMVFVAAIIAGLYPAFFSTKFHTVNLLKGNIKIKGTNGLTHTLISIQFAISVIVLTAGIIFIQNTRYQEAIDFGYDKDELMTINIKNEQQYRRMEPAIKALPNVKEVGSTEHHIGFSTYRNPVTYDNMEYEVVHLEFGENYFETLQFKFLNGRPINYESAQDYKNAIVVTKQFIKALGINGDPIGQQVEVRQEKRAIVGVIDDFVENLYRSKDPEPIVFVPTFPDRWRDIVVRTDADNLKATNDKIEEIWKKLFPSDPYVSRYQEDILLSNMRQVNQNLKKIFLFLTILGGLLSASGIFSLASLNIAKRTKEIGIRKALGASVPNIVMLLNREFVIILVAAGFLGAIGGYLGTSWLLDFIYAYHMPMTLIPVALSALIIFGVGIFTTSITILKAASANPVDTLRDE